MVREYVEHYHGERNHQGMPREARWASSILLPGGVERGRVLAQYAVSSNEPGAEQFQITGDLTANFLAAHSGDGSGRVYTIVVQCTDASNNAAKGSVDVRVPHDNRR
jgi:hypothetical protein